MSSIYSSGSSRVSMFMTCHNPMLTQGQRPSGISLSSTIHSRRHGSLVGDAFDSDAVFSELNYYKTELHGEPDLRSMRSFSAREAEDVAAATRFRLELERQQQPNGHEDDSSQPPPLPQPLPLRTTSLPRPSPLPQSASEYPYQQESRQLRRRKTPEPIVVTGIDRLPQEVQSAHLPPRDLDRRSPDGSGDNQAMTKAHRRHVTISEGRGLAGNLILLHSPTGGFSECPPPLPALSPSTSIITPRFPDMPSTPLSLNPPNEDQIRREIELFALQDGAESLVGHKYRNRAPPSLELNSDDEDQDLRGSSRVTSPRFVKDDDQRSIVSVTPSVKRRKSIFAIFQRKSELEKLLDLYLSDDAPEEVQPVKTKSSLARRMTRSRRRKLPEVPDVPPLPPILRSKDFRPG